MAREDWIAPLHVGVRMARAAGLTALVALSVRLWSNSFQTYFSGYQRGAGDLVGPGNGFPFAYVLLFLGLCLTFLPRQWPMGARFGLSFVRALALGLAGAWLLSSAAEWIHPSSSRADDAWSILPWLTVLVGFTFMPWRELVERLEQPATR